MFTSGLKPVSFVLLGALDIVFCIGIRIGGNCAGDGETLAIGTIHARLEVHLETYPLGFRNHESQKYCLFSFVSSTVMVVSVYSAAQLTLGEMVSVSNWQTEVTEIDPSANTKSPTISTSPA